MGNAFNIDPTSVQRLSDVPINVTFDPLIGRHFVTVMVFPEMFNEAGNDLRDRSSKVFYIDGGYLRSNYSGVLLIGSLRVAGKRIVAGMGYLRGENTLGVGLLTQTISK